MNMKIIHLLEHSTRELQTLTDINPQSCLHELGNESKDPIEDAFIHLRSLLTFQTTLKSYVVRNVKSTGGSVHFSEVSESTMKEHNDFYSNDFQNSKDSLAHGYSLLHSSRSTSREK